MPNKVDKLIRPLVRKLHPYVPGEQPSIAGLIKLNTNENPYPPAPSVLRRVKVAVDGRLRLYPNPTAENLRRKLAKFHRLGVENLIVGNGSDELLAMALRAFVEPPSSATGKSKAAATVQYFDPSYSLYPVLAEAHGAIPVALPLNDDFSFPTFEQLRRASRWHPGAALTMITTPNAPSGRGYSNRELERICRAHSGVVILDEAYADFAVENAMKLAVRLPNVLVARTFSKGYSLCFQRIGYMVGSAALIGALHKIRDSYNVNGLGQIAAEATLDDLPYYQRNIDRICKSRVRLSKNLAALGFRVLPSQTNFVLVEPLKFRAETSLRLLREQKILVRWFNTTRLKKYLRITVGSEREVAALLRALEDINEGKNGVGPMRRNP